MFDLHISDQVINRNQFSMILFCYLGRATLDMTVTTNGIYVGQTVTFTCKETGKDHVKIRGWLKNGLNMSLSQESRITTAPPYYKDRLTLQQAVTSDSGVYTCVAEDGRNASQNLIVYCTCAA
jgi:hypothetical protein